MPSFPRKTILSVAAVLFLAACNGGDDEGAATTGGADQSGAVETEAAPAGGTAPAP